MRGSRIVSREALGEKQLDRESSQFSQPIESISITHVQKQLDREHHVFDTNQKVKRSNGPI
jgi:hypothetical protein